MGNNTDTLATPRSHPLVGDMIALCSDQLGYMHRMRQQHGRFIRLPVPMKTVYLVTDPALIEHVFVTDNKSYGRDIALRLIGSELLGHGLFTSEGQVWLRQRRLSQPAFHRERITEYADVMAACAQEYAAELQPGQTRDLIDDILRVTLRTVLRTMLSLDDEQTATDIKHAIDVAMRRYSQILFYVFPALTRLPLPVNRRFAQAKRTLEDITLRIIRQRRAAPAEPHNDLLSMFIAAQDEDNSRMTDVQLRDEVLTTFVAGYKTTAVLVYYAFLLVSQHPKAQASLGAELASVLAGRAPTFHDLPALRYTEAVLLESLRLYPPAWSLAREAVRDTELGGCTIARGSQLWMGATVVHHDPEYFPQPEEFAPERWLDGLQKRLPRFAFMPFGGGPRQCIGNSFAMTEAMLLLSTIANRYRFRIEKDPRQPMRFLLSFTLYPRDKVYASVEAV